MVCTPNAVTNLLEMYLWSQPLGLLSGAVLLARLQTSSSSCVLNGLEYFGVEHLIACSDPNDS